MLDFDFQSDAHSIQYVSSDASQDGNIDHVMQVKDMFGVGCVEMSFGGWLHKLLE